MLRVQESRQFRPLIQSYSSGNNCLLDMRPILEDLPADNRLVNPCSRAGVERASWTNGKLETSLSLLENIALGGKWNHPLWELQLVAAPGEGIKTLWHNSKGEGEKRKKEAVTLRERYKLASQYSTSQIFHLHKWSAGICLNTEITYCFTTGLSQCHVLLPGKETSETENGNKL